MAKPKNPQEYKIISFLAVIALVLGAAIFQQTRPQGVNQSSEETEVAAPSPTSQSQATSSAQRRPLPENLTEDEKAVLDPPSLDAPADEKQAHYNLAVKLAQTASNLDLNKCSKPNPLVMKITNGENFTAKNSDTVEHTIVIDQDHHYAVAPGGSATIKADFGHGLGVYGYLCDNVPGVVGFFLVTP